MTSTSLTVVNYVFDTNLRSPEALLARYDALTEWCRAVARTGVRVRLVQAYARDTAFLADGVEWVFRQSGSAHPHQIGRLHRSVLEHAADVVHVNGIETVVQTWLLRRALPETTALVVQHHGGAPPRSQLSAIAKRALMRDIDGFLFTSLTQADDWVAGGLLARERVHEVLEASSGLYPVNREDARERTGMHGLPAILWVGRLVPNKDPLTVLRAFFLSADRLPGSTLTMIFQDAQMLKDVQQEIAAHPAAASRVRLIGEVPHHEMSAWYSAADVFVLGSASEVCGYAALEACACGAVPVLSDIPAFRAVTGEGQIGRLWTRGDADACADALVEACAQLPAGRARVASHFEAHLSWDAVARRACDIYAQVRERRCRARDHEVA